MSREAVTFARSLSEAGGGVPVDAVVVGDVSDGLREQLAAYGVRDVHALDRRGVRRVRRGRLGGRDRGPCGDRPRPWS